MGKGDVYSDVKTGCHGKFKGTPSTVWIIAQRKAQIHSSNWA